MGSLSRSVVFLICIHTVRAMALPNMSNDEDIKGENYPVCTNSTQGLPQCFTESSITCDFKFPHNVKADLQWRSGNNANTLSNMEIEGGWQSEEKDRIRKVDSLNYFYVNMSDENVPISSKAYLSSSKIDNNNIDSVCISFRYAVISDGVPPIISIMNKKSNYRESEEMIGFIYSVQNNTNGLWMQVEHHAFIWKNSEIVIEAEKRSKEESAVAITEIKVTQSRLMCECPVSTGGLPACHFNKNWCGLFQNDTENESLVWKKRQSLHSESPGDTIARDMPWRISPPGYFAYVDVLSDQAEIGSKSSLLAAITSTHVTNICIKFHYATTGDIPQTIKVYHKFANETMRFIGLVTDKTHGKWKEASFKAKLLPNRRDNSFPTRHTKPVPSYIALQVEKVSSYSYVALDNVRVSEIRIKTPPDPTTTTTTTPTTYSTTTVLPTVPETTSEKTSSRSPEMATTNATTSSGKLYNTSSSASAMPTTNTTPITTTNASSTDIPPCTFTINHTSPFATTSTTTITTITTTSPTLITITTITTVTSCSRSACTTETTTVTTYAPSTISSSSPTTISTTTTTTTKTTTKTSSEEQPKK